MARLIDSDAEGLIDKAAFEPRITRLRQRLARLEEQRQALAEEATGQRELSLIIGRLEDPEFPMSLLDFSFCIRYTTCLRLYPKMTSPQTPVGCTVFPRRQLLRRLQEVQRSPDEAGALLDRVQTHTSRAEDREQ